MSIRVEESDQRLSTITVDRRSADITESMNMYHAAGGLYSFQSLERMDPTDIQAESTVPLDWILRYTTRPLECLIIGTVLLKWEVLAKCYTTENPFSKN